MDDVHSSKVIGRFTSCNQLKIHFQCVIVFSVWQRLHGDSDFTGCTKSDSCDAFLDGPPSQPYEATPPQPYGATPIGSTGTNSVQCNDAAISSAATSTANISASHEMGNRNMSVASDTKLLEEEISCEMRSILRPKRPPRPQSEAFLDRVADGSKGGGNSQRRSKRYSAFGVSNFFSQYHNPLLQIQC